jgi:hypothetical protein
MALRAGPAPLTLGVVRRRRNEAGAAHPAWRLAIVRMVPGDTSAACHRLALLSSVVIHFFIWRKTMTTEPLSTEQVEMAKLYWEEFSYRHAHYWSMFFRFAFAILFMLAFPFIHPEEVQYFKRYTAIFPMIAILLSLAASWLLAAEYERIRATYQKYSELRSAKYNPPEISERGARKLLRMRIGTVVTLFFLFGLLSLSGGALWVILTAG